MKSRDLAYIALFAAIIAVLGLLPAIYPLGSSVPITAQTLGVMLAGSVLGARRGALAVLTFLIVVAAGLPVLSGGRGGLVWFASASAGYLYSWPIAALVIGLITQLTWRRFNLGWAMLANLVGGVAVVYAIGIPFVSVYTDTSLTAAAAAAGSFVPFDLVKVGIASVVAVAVHKAYPVIELPRRRPAAG